MKEAECYIKIYGYENFKSIEHYDLVKRFARAVCKGAEERRSRLIEQFSESKPLYTRIKIKK